MLSGTPAPMDRAPVYVGSVDSAFLGAPAGGPWDGFIGNSLTSAWVEVIVGDRPRY